MSTWLAPCGAAAALIAAFIIPAAAAGEVLKVCLDEDLPPLSAHHRGKPDSGFDVALAGAIAEQLGRPLKIQWFESKLDEDSSPALEANALLSDGRCSLVGSYALTKDFWGKRTILLVLLSCMMIPFHATIIPAYLITANLGLLNSYMGLALPAELNGYPGPLHVLELADALGLTVEQRSRTQALTDAMRAETIPIGLRIVAEETALDGLFAEKTITPARLRDATRSIAASQGNLRAAHLRYHLIMAEVLTPEQTARYNHLRGYGSVKPAP